MGIAKMKTLALLSLVSLSFASQLPFSAPLSSSFTPPQSAFTPTTISRSIELAGSLTRQTTTYQLTQSQSNKGSEWVVGVPGQEGFIEAFESTGGAKKVVKITKLGRTTELTRPTRLSNTTFYSLTPTSQTSTFALSSVTSHQSINLPAQLPQIAEIISLQWTDDLLSPINYLSAEDCKLITEFRVKIKTPTPRIIDIKAPEGFEAVRSKGAAGVTFFAKSVDGLGPQIASVHYAQPEAIASFRKLDRLIEVSHWGSNVAFMDSIDLINSGPTLSGHFARIDHQKLTMQRRSNFLSITGLTFSLPAHASSPYYYDIVGNVSTSHFRPSAYSNPLLLPSQKRKNKGGEASVLEIKPRYPLQGGWNYTFTMGYDAPLADYLKKREDGTFVLAVPFLTPVKDIAVDDVTVEIRLPEAARNIKVHLPFDVDSLSYPTSPPTLFQSSPGYTHTYLDSTGRPTIKIARKNCGDRHGGLVIVRYLSLSFLPAFVLLTDGREQIEYTASPMLDLLQKPVAIATFFLTLVLAIVGTKRIEWGIGK
ncbi:oligosaccharyltransferase complex subunit alpha (ribophorin I), partial [Phenoliferia sp. Uapishka_3]